MDDEEIAVIVRYWHDLQTNLSQLRVVHVASGEEVHLSDGSFLLRISLAQDGTVIRCFVRHLTSGREAYLQGGANLRTFINACLLNDGGQAQDLPLRASPPETLTEDTNE
ncbi:MAG: hypothetical protein ACJ788_14815 [Ktedonobacteraceae bacterium]|jgi:hypothetical protein